MKIQYSYDKHEMKRWHWAFLLFLIFGAIYIFRQEHGDKAAGNDAAWEQSMVQRKEGMTFGTVYHITYDAAMPLDEGIEETLKKVDESLSPFNKKSTITAVNNNSCMVADSMLIKVFLLAKDISAETDGAFDITVAPLVNLWGFGFKNDVKISDESVDSLRKFVGFEKVSLEGSVIRKDMPETMLDCSAIAKGFGVDAVGEYLESQGVRDYMVEIGGEVRLRGLNPKGLKWTIGITKPMDDSLCNQSDIQEVIQATNISMATSGNYRNFYIKDGKKYAHTIDPHTGYPVQHSVLSSTVLAKDCATADAYATSFMVLGLEKAKKVLERHEELMAFFVYTDEKGEAKEWYSPRLEALLKNKK